MVSPFAKTRDPRQRLQQRSRSAREVLGARFFGGCVLAFACLSGCAGEVNGDEAEVIVVELPKHWSFEPMAQQDPPDMAEDEWVRSPIDAFVLTALRDAGREPAPEASPAKQLRRVALDLTGLPPTLEELDAFLADPSDEAYAAYVDDLLASPRYAEHMTAEWLDMARYSDTDGFQYDIPRPAWPWRDWVVNAFNTNMPWDQFTIQQIAGDLLPDKTEQTVLATAFNRNHAIQGENGLLKNEFRDRYVSDRIETMGKAWLGLTLGCAKCHDHKYDPISAEDYHRFYDCFNQLDEYDNGPSSKFSPVLELPSPYEEQVTAELNARIEQRTADGASSLEIATMQRDLRTIADVAPIRVMWDSDTHRDTRVLALGRYDAPVGEPVHCSAPAALPPFPEGAPQNRLGLAQWLVMPGNPLVSRVTVNRVWSRHFGRGISRSIDDFGVRVDAPELTELLDWLATHFIESGWDLKALHRLIVTSSTYRQSSDTTGEELEVDPKNDLFGRAGRFRLPAEVVRDLPLFVSGLLVERLGGPPAYPYQTAGLWEELAWEGLQLTYPVLGGDTLYRRSVYSFWKKTLPPPFMSMYDAPDRELASAYREPAVSPQQGLALLNSVQFIEAARHFSARIMTEVPADPGGSIALGFRIVTSREPTETELALLLEVYESQLTALTQDAAAATAIQYMGDSAPSDVAPEAAAMTQVARVLFNLSETITQE